MTREQKEFDLLKAHRQQIADNVRERLYDLYEDDPAVTDQIARERMFRGVTISRVRGGVYASEEMLTLYSSMGVRFIDKSEL